jgi:16S rRNA (guanine966-N2)-methyltransferase
MPRIIAGKFGGRQIRAPGGRGTRPTASRIREAWFSALSDSLAGARIVDLFAGSGALGFEALSRGAAHAHFVESNGRAAAAIRENIRTLGVTDRATLVVRDVFGYLVKRGQRRDGFDIALADPPYASDAAWRLVARFETEPFARLFCLEHPSSLANLGGHVVWTRTYGDTQLTFLESDPSDPPMEP